jgi:hypothetical protein
MPNVWVIRDQITDALGSALRKGDHGLSVVPGLLRRAIKEKAWGERVVHQTKQQIPAFPSLRVYIETAPPEGLGATCDIVERLIKDDTEILALFRKATTRGKGQPKKSNGDIITIKPERGTSRAYLLERLQRERRDLFNKVLADELSANAAAIEAGFRPKTITVRVDKVENALRILLKHFTASEIEKGLISLSSGSPRPLRHTSKQR